MTRSEYQELVGFLGTKFDAIDRRFEAIEARLAAVEERLTRVEVRVEENGHQIQIRAEGLTGTNQRLDRFQEKVTEEFRDVRGDMAIGFAGVGAEMAGGFRAQGKMIKGLGARADRWEGRSA